MSIYFISDLHLGHAGLLNFRCAAQNRTFGGVEGMNEWLVEGWNSVVKKKNDIVWVLGDVAWGAESLHYLSQMNGRKRVVLGNHDTERAHISEYLKYFEEAHGVVKKYGVVMTHVPIHPENLEYRWEYNVHGHIHDPYGKFGNIKNSRNEEESNKTYTLDSRYINVNVDVIGNKPMHLDELRSKLK